MKQPKFSTLLRNKTRSCSASAAAVTITVHLLILLFAGSVVVVRYVQKQNAQLTAWTEDRPKLERRRLQSPARVEQLQKRALTSKIVSKKISFSNPEFTLPDTGKIGSLKTQKSDLPGFDTRRVFRNLSFSAGVGPSYINFFGIRAESEKAVFVVDASSAMRDDSVGGDAADEYVKSELIKIVSGMKPSMLFNLIFYDGQHIYMFRSQMVPVTKDTASAFSEWVQQINRDAASFGLTGALDNYVRPEPYPTAVGSDADGWLLALQAAFEQRADSVFLLCAGWGKHHISTEKRRLLRDFSLWEILGGSGSSAIGGTPILRDDRKLRDGLVKQAVESIKKEEESRKQNGSPAEFLHDIPAYIEYPADQIISHAETVCLSQYTKSQIPVPQLHVVRLVPADQYGRSDNDDSQFRRLVRGYKGQFESFSSELVTQDQQTAAQTVDSADIEDQAVSPKRSRSRVELLGADVSASKVAFVINASADMLSEKTGGTNTFAWIKTRLLKSVSELEPGTLFNVIAYDHKKVALFRNQMAAAPAGAAGLREWLAALNSGERRGLLPEQNNYTPARIYETAIGSDIQSMPYALQAAMDEQADAILIVSSGMDSQPVSQQKAARLLDFSIWGALGASSGSAGSAEETEETDGDGNVTVNVAVTAGASSSSGGMLQPLQQDKKMASALLKQTLSRIAAEKKARQDAGLPPGFVPDILNSIEYPRGQVMDHISTVCDQDYVSQELDLPAIHLISLLETGTQPSRELSRDLNALTKPYNGSVIFLDSADIPQ